MNNNAQQHTHIRAQQTITITNTKTQKPTSRSSLREGGREFSRQVTPFSLLGKGAHHFPTKSHLKNLVVLRREGCTTPLSSFFTHSRTTYISRTTYTNILFYDKGILMEGNQASPKSPTKTRGPHR
jgi:hypothetical protein